MKLHSSKAGKAGNDRRAAFTMIEMIGVLAVIAILAAMLIPRVFQAVDTARVNSTAVAIETVKAATISHYGKYGRFDITNNVPMAMPASGIFAGYDTNVLMAEALLDKPFSVRIAGGDPSANCAVELVTGGKENGGTGIGYKLDGLNNLTSTSQYVMEAIIQNCSAADAKELNDLIDGAGLGAPDLTSADAKGRVEYIAPVNGVTTVYVYMTHR